MKRFTAFILCILLCSVTCFAGGKTDKKAEKPAEKVSEAVTEKQDAAEYVPEDNSQPRLMVTGYVVENGYLTPEKDGKITVTLKNMHSKKAVKNIKLSVGDETDEIRPDGMGTKYDVAIDRESAYEIMNSITELETVQIESTAEAIKKNQNDIELTFEDVTELQKKIEAEEAKRQKRYEKEQAVRQKKAQKEAEKRKKQLEKLLTNAAGARTVTMINNTIKRPVTKNQTAVQKSINSAINSTMRTVGRQTSQNIVRGILGNLLK